MKTMSSTMREQSSTCRKHGLEHRDNYVREVLRAFKINTQYSVKLFLGFHSSFANFSLTFSRSISRYLSRELGGGDQT